MARNTRVRGIDDHDAAEAGRAEAVANAPNASDRRGFFHSFLHNRSVRVRVAGLVFIPLLGALIFGASVFYTALSNWSTANAVERNAETVRAVLTVVDRLQDERDVTSLQQAGVSGDSAVVQVRNQTDAALASLEELLDDLPADDESAIVDATQNARVELAKIGEYRAGSVDRYRFLIRTLLQFVTATGSGLTDPAQVEEIDVLDSVARATEAASLERGLLAHLIALGTPVNDARTRFVSVARTEQDLLIERFARWASSADWIEYSEARKDVEEIRREVLNPASNRSFTPQEWYETSSARIDVMRDLQAKVADSIVNRAASSASSSRWAAAGTAAIVFAMLVLTVLVAYAVARSIVRPLRRLRGAALEAADSGLPALVSRIQEDGPAVVRNVGDAVTPEGSDEIGQLASAFNEVHATALRVAGQQALLRQNLDTIVVNLSRRTQSLIDRQLSEIEDLESRERDPDQLGTLFRIDHLATRVRRHAESLLVLAGVEEMRRQGVAAPVLDVVRTAVGEVEQYPRVKFGVMPTDLVVPSAVDDVAHLLAELLDNATEFSAPSTAVTVTSQPLLGGGLRLQVTDQGLGIPADQLALLNDRLREPGDIDVAASRTLGIYVVARLAARHGITVRLIPAEATSGTIAQVDLPAHLVVSPLDTTDGVLQAIQPTPTPRTESLLTTNRPPTDNEQPDNPPLPSRPTPVGNRGRTGLSEPSNPTQPIPSARPSSAQPGSPAPAGGGRSGAAPQRPGTATPGRPATPTPPAATPEPAPTRRSPEPAPPRRPSPTPEPVGAQASASRQPSLRAPEPPLPPGDSPIYDQVRSAWFRRGGTAVDWSSPADEGWRRAAAALRTAEDAAMSRRTAGRSTAPGTRPATAPPPGTPAQPPPRHSVRPPTGQPAPGTRPAPAPWTSGGTPGPAAAQAEGSGLPVRRRGATLVPGSIPGAEEAGRAGGPVRRPADAGNVASTLSNLQRGVSRGRQESGGWVPKRPSDSERSNQ